ncbi:MAG: hypothetical protein ACYDHG_04295 [Desulfomonilaceae bacterium]
MKRNLRFNRHESDGKHFYIKDLENYRHSGHKKYSGFLKCKLAHDPSYSVVVPDQIYLDSKGASYWIQPLYFSANRIAISEHSQICHIGIDISFGAVLSIEFKPAGVIKKLRDGSFLYKCKIVGPKNLHRYATGASRLHKGTPYLELFHHTNRQAKDSILKSSEFRTSIWNIQGTKKLRNISYLYLSALDKIQCTADLHEIAMSNVGFIPVRLDSNPTNIPDDQIDVYPENVVNRLHTISTWIRADYLSPQNVYRHEHPGKPVDYEIASPFVQKAGVLPDSVVRICKSGLIPSSPKSFEYMVVGTATTTAGLRQPFDEEDTRQIWKIQRIDDGEDIIGFWIANANTSLYDGQTVELAEFYDD